MKFLGTCSLIALLIAPVAAGAQDAGEWASECNDTSCTLSRTAVNPSNGQRAGTILAVVEKSSDTITIGAVAPLGIALEAGIRLVIGETSEIAKMDVCFPDGCRGLIQFAPSVFTGIENIDMRYFPFGSERPLSILIPLEGFDAGVAQARATLAGN